MLLMSAEFQIETSPFAVAYSVYSELLPCHIANSNNSYPVCYFTSSGSCMESDEIHMECNCKSLSICISHALHRNVSLIVGGVSIL